MAINRDAIIEYTSDAMATGLGRALDGGDAGSGPYGVLDPVGGDNADVAQGIPFFASASIRAAGSAGK